jgi:hypothetical protein
MYQSTFRARGIDISGVKPPQGEEMYPSMSASHGLYGKVVQTVGSKEEADKLKGKGAKLRAIQVTHDLKPGHWVNPSEMVAEICRSLPPRGR